MSLPALSRNYVSLTAILALTTLGIIGWMYSNSDSIVGSIVGGIVTIVTLHQQKKSVAQTT